MAIKEVRREWDECQLDYVKEFILHTEADVANLPECCVGSTATVGATNNVYVCCPSGEWKRKDEAMQGKCKQPDWGDSEIAILPETKLDIVSNPDLEGMPATFISPITYPEHGDDFTVTFNGTDYTFTYREGSGFYGNLGVVGEEDTGEPFCLSLDKAEGGSFVFNSTEMLGVTIAISCSSKKRIAEDYINKSAVVPGYVDLVALGLPTIIEGTVKSNMNISRADMLPVLEKAKKGSIAVKVLITCNVESPLSGGATESYTNQECVLHAFVTQPHISQTYEGTNYLTACDLIAFWKGKTIYLQLGENNAMGIIAD